MMTTLTVCELTLLCVVLVDHKHMTRDRCAMSLVLFIDVFYILLLSTSMEVGVLPFDLFCGCFVTVLREAQA